MIVEHNIKSVLDVAHRAYVLKAGRTVFSGTGREAQTSDVIKKIFLGEAE
jgi:ABC-type lipopolysaccharide export system ATPase subunit